VATMWTANHSLTDASFARTDALATRGEGCRDGTEYPGVDRTGRHARSNALVGE